MDPFLRDDSSDLGDLITDAAVRVIDEEGVGRLTVSAIARRIGVTPQAVTQRLGGERGARYRVLQLATVSFRFRWEAWVDGALLSRTPVPALPAGPEELRGVRVWLGFHELARAEERRGNDHVAGALAGARAAERAGTHRQLERWIGQRIPESPVRRLCYLADGLRFELAQVSPVVDPAAAGEVLLEEMEAIRALHGPGGGQSAGEPAGPRLRTSLQTRKPDLPYL